jgi:hypothetical protein
MPDDGVPDPAAPRVEPSSEAIDPEVRRRIDEEHLRLLRIGYLVSGILNAVFSIFLAAGVVLKLAVASAIRRRRGHTLCLVGAAWTCLGIPWETVLGLLTFVVLERPGVRALFSTGSGIDGGGRAAAAHPG